MTAPKAHRTELDPNAPAWVRLRRSQPGEFFHPPPGNEYKWARWLKAKGERRAESP